MIEPERREPSISLQCQLLDLSRSSFYYKPRPIDPEDLELMRLIDEQYLKTPVYGSRSMARHFRRQGRGQPQAHPAADAADGHRGDLSQAPHQPAASGA